MYSSFAISGNCMKLSIWKCMCDFSVSPMSKSIFILFWGTSTLGLLGDWDQGGKNRPQRYLISFAKAKIGQDWAIDKVCIFFVNKMSEGRNYLRVPRSCFSIFSIRQSFEDNSTQRKSCGSKICIEASQNAVGRMASTA